MSLIVEDGTGLATAESYVAVDEADAYFVKHPNPAWENADDKESALRAATQFADGEYGARWQGYRLNPITQRLDFPRVGIDIEGYCLPPAPLPAYLKEAICELAVRWAAFGDLAPDVTEGAIAATSITVGAITKSVTYANAGKPAVISLRLVDLLLSKLLNPRGQLERA